MNHIKIQYGFVSKPWKYDGPGGWIFVSLPKKLSDEIRETFKKEEAAWGRLKASARIGATVWQTAIWFDRKASTYLLPLKAEIRKKEKVEVGMRIDVSVLI